MSDDVSGRAALVQRFRRALPEPERYALAELNPHVFTVASEVCLFRFLFERCEDEYGLEVQEPELPSGAEPMSFLVLRHIRGAHLPEAPNPDAPEYFARLCGLYLSDLLAGDFSVRADYEAVFPRFCSGVFTLQTLPPDHPTRMQADRFDIGWLASIGSQGA